MSNPSMTFSYGYAVPRGSRWASSAMVALVGALRRMDNWLLASRQDEPQTAEEVLAWAQRIESREPGFASDLRAAAQRSLSRDE